jgi:hypothetical protein
MVSSLVSPSTLRMDVAQKSAREGRGQDGAQPDVVNLKDVNASSADQILSQSAIFFSHVMIARSSPLLLHRTRPAINAIVSFTQVAGERTQDFASTAKLMQSL